MSALHSLIARYSKQVTASPKKVVVTINTKDGSTAFTYSDSEEWKVQTAYQQAKDFFKRVPNVKVDLK